MADNDIVKRSEENRLAEDDPFAELTRIMGHEPVGSQSEQEHPQDDIALDLENELLGMEAEGPTDDAAEQPSAKVIPWRQEPQGAPPEPPQESMEAEKIPDDLLGAALDDALNAADQPQGTDTADTADDIHADVQVTPSESEPQPTAAAFETPDQDLPEESVASPEADSDALIFRDFRPLPDIAVSDDVAEPPLEDEPAPEEHLAQQPDEPILEPEPSNAGQDNMIAFEAAAPETPHIDTVFEPTQEAAAPETDVTEPSFDYAKAAAERHDLLSPEELAAGLDLGLDEPEPAPDGAEPVLHFGSLEEPPAQQDDGIGDGDLEWHSAPEVQDDDARVHSSGSDPLPPDIETVDVPEKVVALADHLDIPDVSYREDVKPAPNFDEIEELLAGAFGDPVSSGSEGRADGASQDEQSAPDYPDEEEDPASYLPAGMAGATFSVNDPGHAHFGHHEARDSGYPDDWAPSGDWDEGQPVRLAPEPGVEPPTDSGTSRLRSRLLLAGAVCGAVVILGGVTLFALNFGESGDAGPVVVSADNGPVKVQPEDPGGIEIPNQDSQVYRRVSGEQSDAEPEQANLISGAEEPVEVPQPARPVEASAPVPEQTASEQSAPASQDAAAQEGVALAPPPEAAENETSSASANSSESAAQPNAGTDTGAEADMVAAAKTDQSDLPGVQFPGEEGAKAEARLEESALEPAGEESQVVSLTPRRVQSLVVRPDGSMVPYEAPAPAADAAEGEASSDAAEVTPAVMPDTGPIPPARPANVAAVQPQAASPAQSQQPAAASQEPQTQQPAATAQPAQSGGSPWSVQIASQPTAEGAQQSYQELARRYGNMLEGRGVNIVKADIQGKGTYYRVRIPSDSKEGAIQLCSRLKSAGGNCFVSQ